MSITPEFTKAYKKLNKNQKKAVDTIEGPVMVIAGPGTGKTQILTLRIANILRKTDTPPEGILALTFTESAAANMKRRLVSLVGPTGYKVRVNTFHGFANSIIKENSDFFERFMEASAITDIEKVLLIADILDKGDFKELKPFYDNHIYLKDIMGAISQLKRDAISPESFNKWIIDVRESFENNDEILNPKTGKVKTKYASYVKKMLRSEELVRVFKEYERALQREQLYDFEDMILEVVNALQNNEELKMLIQERFLYVLADEHQDANDAQNKLLELLTDFHDSPNLFIVGDEKQAIYRFQGASLDNFLYFRDKFKKVTLVELTDSYRSGQAVLDVSHSLMESSKDNVRRPKLISQADVENEVVEVAEYQTEEAEMAIVANRISGMIDEGVPAEEIAVLYRTNADAGDIARALLRKGVVYNIESDVDALKDVGIQSFLTLLKAINKFGEDEPLAKVLHLPFLHLKEIDIYKLFKYSRRKQISLYDIVTEKKTIKKSGIKSATPIFVLSKRLEKYSKRAKTEPVTDILNDIMNEFGFLAYVLNSPNNIDVLDKLHALIKDAQTMSAGKNDYMLGDFLDHLSLLERHSLSINKPNKINKREAVHLLTAHKAKGLEFEYVFMIKAYDGKWGSRLSRERFLLPVKGTAKDENDADERRLFFVALTRAKRGVFISYSRVSPSGKERLPSVFISEINTDYLTFRNTRREERKLNPVDFLQFKRKDDKTFADINYLRNLFLEQGLSVTALNNFLTCPWRFFYNNLIRIPKIQNKYMILGNAIHFTLSVLYENANKNKKTTKTDLEKLLEKYIKKRALSETVFNETFSLSKEYIFAWLQENKNVLGKHKTLNEYEVVVHLPIRFNSTEEKSPETLRLSGKLDRIDLLSDGREVKVTDYKTGVPKSRNAILGKIKSDSSGDYFRQLVFYKLLLDLEGKYEMTEGVVDFIQPKSSGKLIRESFTITNKDLESLVEEITASAESIYNLSFWEDRCENHANNKCEHCALRDLMR